MQNIACDGTAAGLLKLHSVMWCVNLRYCWQLKQNKLTEKFLASHNFTKKFIKSIDIFIKKDVVALKKVFFAFLAENSEKAG